MDSILPSAPSKISCVALSYNGKRITLIAITSKKDADRLMKHIGKDRGGPLTLTDDTTKFLKAHRNARRDKRRAIKREMQSAA